MARTPAGVSKGGYMNGKKLVIIALVMVMVLLSGCMQILQEVRVNRDGTGMMVETLKLSPMVAEFMEEFAQEMSDSEGTNQEGTSREGLFPEEQFRENAKEMGEGVEFVSREVKEFEGGMVGYEATYSIADIDKFILNPRTDEATMEKPSTDTPITFRLSRGTSSSTLTIKQHFPIEEGSIAEEEDEAPPAQGELSEADAEQVAQFAGMMKGMRMQIIIECGDEIENTNAEWWSRNRIVLMDFDAEELFSHPEKLQMLSQMQQSPSKEDFDNLLEGIEGIRFDTSEEIKVTFR